MNNHVKTRGRLVYMEPNLLPSIYGIHGGSPDKFMDNITWNPEDFNMSVDLQVIMPYREDCGLTGNAFEVQISNMNNQMASFLSGTPLKDKSGNELGNDLTTNYINASYQEIYSDHVSNRECLGIESIDISFDPHFYPKVTIKFHDTRGFSLMMPQEKQYLDRLKKVDSSYSNFFNALFHFPYPRFLLTIKGYFGNAVTFMLAVSDFKSSFNASNGGFDVTVSFIGYMYGLYTDIPLNVLICAPYYGINNGDSDTIVEPNPKFTEMVFDDTFNNSFTQMKTFIDHISDCANLRLEMDGQIKGKNETDLTRLVELREKQTKYENINNLLNDFFAAFSNFMGDGVNNPFSAKAKNSYTIKNNDCVEVFTDGVYTLYEDSSSNTHEIPSSVRTSWANFAKTIKEVDLPNITNKNINFYPDNNIKWVDELNSLRTDVGNFDYRYKVENGTIISINGHGGFPSVNTVKLPSTAYTATIHFDKKPISDVLENEIKKVNTEISKLSESVDEIETESYLTNLGFDPTINNYFRMIFAHMSIFMTIFYEKLEEIKNSKRKLVDYGINVNDTDLKSDAVNGFLPPFPAVYKYENGKKVEAFPSEVNDQLGSITEVEFVKSFANGIITAKHNGNAIENLINERTSVANDYEKSVVTETNMPFTCHLLTDFRCDKNPYLYNLSGTYNIGSLLYNFVNRIGAYEFLNEVNVYENDSEFIEKEQEIFAALANPKSVSRDFLDALNKITKEVSEKKIDKEYIIYNINNLGIDKVKNDNEEYLIYNIQNNMLLGNESQKSSDVTNTYYTYFDIYDDKTSIKKDFISNNVDSKHYTNTLSFFNANTYNKMHSFKYVDGNYNQVEIEFSTFCTNENVSTALNYRYFALTLLLSKTRHISGLLNMINPNIGIVFKNNHLLHLTSKWFLIYIGCYFKCLKQNINVISFSFLPRAIVKGMKIDEAKLRTVDDIYKNRFIKYYEDNISLVDDLMKMLTNKNSYDIKTKKINDKEYDLYYINKDSQLDNYLRSLIKEEAYVLSITNDRKKLNSNSFIYFDTIGKFIQGLYNKYYASENEERTNEVTKTTGEESYVSNAHLLALYKTFKNLYDKWLNSYNKESFRLRTPEEEFNVKKNRFVNGDTNFNSGDITEFDNFLFVDCFYSDISNRFRLNPNTVCDIILKHLKLQDNYSVYEFMSEICQKNNMMMIALPVYNNYYSETSMHNVFTPNPHDIMKMGYGTTYVCMYTYEPSHVLEDNVSGSGYADDGIDLALIASEEQYPNMCFSDDTVGENELDIKVPAFGVTYAMQNQSYFKSINVNMDNPKVTDYSIANLFELSNMANENEINKPKFVANDIYSIYANRSYNCSVEMMGCANILPMMYFQLNNIPMFRGAYMIYNVEHHIKPGDFTTNFTGVRISKNQLPYNVSLFESITSIDLNRNGSGGYTTGRVLGQRDGAYCILVKNGYTYYCNPPYIKPYTNGINDYKTTRAIAYWTSDSSVYEKLDEARTTPVPLEYRKTLANRIGCNNDRSNVTQFLFNGSNSFPATDKDSRSFCDKVKVKIVTGIKSNGEPIIKEHEMLMNKALHTNLQKAFEKIAEGVSINAGSRTIRKYLVIKQLGEGYCYRKVNNGKANSSMSCHAYGVAFDINWNINPYKNLSLDYDFFTTPNKPNGYPDDTGIIEQGYIRSANNYAVKIFAEYGFGWGGAYGDYMHFSYLNGH